MEKIYCYFELEVSSGIFGTEYREYSMGAISYQFNELDRVKSLLLLNFFIKNNVISLEDVIFFSTCGVSWYVSKSKCALDGLVLKNDSFQQEFALNNFLELPILSFACVQMQKYSICKINIIDHLSFDSLRGMYEPNFDLLE